jgi:hypothetical protein
MSDESGQSAEPQKRPQPLMQVCPFCGAIAEKSDEPCPRCKMENTALTRQATRARIGPWFVMQSRNPSAPGMKFGTLLALIRKGQVTPKSVVRGPTTYQLWRFAARVKGVSREFGVCYSCASDIERSAATCTRCGRSQELPANPDLLLESESQPTRPAFTEVTTKPISQADRESMRRPSDAGGRDAARTSDSTRAPEPARAVEPARAAAKSVSQPPSAAATMAGLADLPNPEEAPTEMKSRARQIPQEGVLTARELAAAFSLQYDPKIDAGGSTGVRGRKLLVAAIVLLLMSGAAATVWYVPYLHNQAVALVQKAYPNAGSLMMDDDSAQTADSGKAIAGSATDRPAWAAAPPVREPPITAPPKAGSDVAGSGASNNSNSAVASAGTSTGSSTANGAPGVGTPAAPADTGTLQGGSPMVTSQPTAPSAPQAATDGSGSGAGGNVSAAAANVQKLRQNAGDDYDTLAMQLRANGLEAESRHDYAGALYYYQQIEMLPHDHWPSDTDQLLKNAQKLSVASDAH